jgi:hypothetical protein
MVAVARDEFLRLRASFDQASALGELHPDAVDLDIDHLNLAGSCSAHYEAENLEGRKTGKVSRVPASPE